MTITLASTVSVPEEVVFRELDGEAVVLNLDTGIYFGLDDVGTAIWQWCEKERRLSRVAEAIVDEFDVDRDRAERDLLAFVGALVDKGLLAST